MNRLKQITAVLLAASILSGCSEASSQTESLPISATPEVQTVPKETLAEGNIHDNESLYENRDLTSVISMYLTVSTGNEADSSNHTWAEINSHSTYYYDQLGVER